MREQTQCRDSKCVRGEAMETGDLGGLVQDKVILASWGEWLGHGQGVLWGPSQGSPAPCRLLCLLAISQKSAAACQEAGVAPASPFDSLQEEHLKAIKTQTTKQSER